MFKFNRAARLFSRAARAYLWALDVVTAGVINVTLNGVTWLSKILQLSDTKMYYFRRPLIVRILPKHKSVRRLIG
jgi:hypothetical protein